MFKYVLFIGAFFVKIQFVVSQNKTLNLKANSLVYKWPEFRFDTPNLLDYRRIIISFDTLDESPIFIQKKCVLECKNNKNNNITLLPPLDPFASREFSCDIRGKEKVKQKDVFILSVDWWKSKDINRGFNSDSITFYVKSKKKIDTITIKVILYVLSPEIKKRINDNELIRSTIALKENFKRLTKTKQNGLQYTSQIKLVPPEKPENQSIVNKASGIRMISGDRLTMEGNVKWLVYGIITNPFNVDTTVKIIANYRQEMNENDWFSIMRKQPYSTLLLNEIIKNNHETIYDDLKSTIPICLKLRANTIEDFVCVIELPFYFEFEKLINRRIVNYYNPLVVSFDLTFENPIDTKSLEDEIELLNKLKNNIPYKCDGTFYGYANGKKHTQDEFKLLRNIHGSIDEVEHMREEFITENYNNISKIIKSQKEIDILTERYKRYKFLFKDGKSVILDFYPQENKWCSIQSIFIFSWNTLKYYDKNRALLDSKWLLDNNWYYDYIY